jgi:hypothetical protein
MKANTILLFQSMLIFMQMANAAVDTLPQPLPILIAAFIGAFQYYVNHLGNQTDPHQNKTGDSE